MFDHLGTPITIGSCLAYTYGSPVDEGSEMRYAILQEIKPPDQPGRPHTLSVIRIEDRSWLVRNLNDFAKNPDPAHEKYIEKYVKHQGFKNQNAFTVVDFDRIPDDYKKSWHILQQIINKGPENFHARIIAQGHL